MYGKSRTAHLNAGLYANLTACVITDKGIVVTINELKEYALTLGYELSNYDCAEIIETSHKGETIQEAVTDYLNAYEA